MQKLFNNQIHPLKYFYNSSNKNMGVKYFQLCSVSVVNHKKQNKICQSQDSISSVNIKQTICRILRNTTTLNTLRVDLHESYLFFSNYFFQVWFQVETLSLWLAIHLIQIAQSGHCMHLSYLWNMIAWDSHILWRKKCFFEYNWPKMLLTRNYQITIISITFAFLSFTARSISSSFFSMSRRSKACVWK